MSPQSRRSPTPSVFGRHLRVRARDGAARLSMGGASGSVQLPKVVTAVTTSSALVLAALVRGRQARTLGVPQAGRVRHLRDVQRRAPWPWVLVLRPVLADRAVRQWAREGARADRPGVPPRWGCS